MQVLVIFSTFALISSINCFNCSEDATLCQACKKLPETDGVYTYFDGNQCSFYAPENNADDRYSVDERCELIFSKMYPTSCQMGVISNVNLLGNYIQYGIRTTDHSMLLSLEREDCSATWNWWSRLENRTLPAGTGDAKEECDVVQGAFVGFYLVRINPSNFTPNGILCQCTERVSSLPIVATKDDQFQNFNLLLTALLVFIHYIIS